MEQRSNRNQKTKQNLWEIELRKLNSFKLIAPDTFKLIAPDTFKLQFQVVTPEILKS